MADYAYLLETRLSQNQREALAKVRDIAREHSMTVFLTGGAVRDLTSGLPVRDLDVSVQGNTAKLKKPLEKYGIEVWGEYEPSRTLFLWSKGVRLEISSARHEEYPKPGKPIYRWVSILEDLRRRDFTANAMAVSLNEGSYGLLLDPLNGVADIENRIFRLISPYGFLNDPSRLLRVVRLGARTGWDMDDRTHARYLSAKEEGAIDTLSAYSKGYELEEIIHEEDALAALKALESEGWMKQIFPAWTSTKADARGMEALHDRLFELMAQGVRPDLSAAHMELMTAKLAPKDRATLKRLFPQPGLVKHWERLDHAAKEFQTALLDKKNSAPSASWKLLTSYDPEPVLWLAHTSKSAAVQTRFKNFTTVWPKARTGIPTALMLEMRITPSLPSYNALVEQIFLALMDGKLGTEEAMRAFLEPHSPPAPVPVSVRRSRAKRAVRVERKAPEELDGKRDDVHEGGKDHEHLEGHQARKAIHEETTREEEPLTAHKGVSSKREPKLDKMSKPRRSSGSSKVINKSSVARQATSTRLVKHAAVVARDSKKKASSTKVAVKSVSKAKAAKPVPKLTKKPAAKLAKKATGKKPAKKER